MQTLIFTAALISFTLYLSPAHCEQIITDIKNLIVSPDSKSVVLQGYWYNTSPRPNVQIPYVNSVRIECDQTKGICNEYIAKFIQKSDDPRGTVDKPYLFLMKEQFQVIEWNKNTITARAEPRAAEIDLRISISDRTAERTSRETNSRDAQGANQENSILWILH